MKSEEYRVLKMKYLSQGLNSKESHERIGKIIDFQKEITSQMKAKGKSEKEIENKINDIFQKEFAKLY